MSFPFLEFGAGEESRTLDLNLGKVALYQLSYSRIASLYLLLCIYCFLLISYRFLNFDN